MKMNLFVLASSFRTASTGKIVILLRITSHFYIICKLHYCKMLDFYGAYNDDI